MTRRSSDGSDDLRLPEGRGRRRRRGDDALPNTDDAPVAEVVGIVGAALGGGALGVTGLALGRQRACGVQASTTRSQTPRTTAQTAARRHMAALSV
eukprot:CAMPEP_0185706002 /NCGR_PEP_ID=MMETSP1164-20130828/21022_1 /TAXON_ID=1104430 /ORGANISM="Chrysoreinhardia sp, Strain CCMP2950" /LENGTH=95 /DNA_ID=CAMNT_0028373397 /DNA_START=33 /DNA_END=321 /DNA_ORIENTATION=-